MEPKKRHKRSQKVGAPPGTLVYTGEERSLSKVHFHLMEYSVDSFYEKSDASLVDCMKAAFSPKTTWIQVSGVFDPKVIEAIGTKFKLNPLVMEDILSVGQRPKCDPYRDYIYIVFRLFHKENKKGIQDEQLSLILGKNVVLTFSETRKETFDPIRVRIRKEASRMRVYGADYLAYAILDMSVDAIFLTLEAMDEEIERLDQLLMEKPEISTLFSVQKLKRELMLLRKNIWPLREVISQLERKEIPLIGDPVRFFLKDVYDHTVQVIETLEGQRDIVSGMVDLYLSNISLRLNEIMKFLTMVSTLFVPLTFLASLYGMNFENMPGIGHMFGYYMVLGFMLLLTLSMLLFFRHKRWL